MQIKLANKVFCKLTGYSQTHSADEKKNVKDVLNALADISQCHHFAAYIEPRIFKQLGKDLSMSEDPDMITSYLDIFRSPNFLNKIYDDESWSDLILDLLHRCNYTYPKMFFDRTLRYKKKILFTVLAAGKSTDYSWSKVAKSVSAYTRGLLALLESSPVDSKIAFFTKNSLDMVLFDLACLTGGIINVMIPANSVPSHIEYILERTKPSVLIVSDYIMLEKITAIVNRLSYLKAFVLIENTDGTDGKIYTKEKVIELGKKITVGKLSKQRNRVRLNDLASIMFTSGTTGNPKGIQFSHQNIIFKRFARAMALPAIGENDSFLAYLPLFHTFGRWLEMTGSIFWGARYIFMDNPAPEIMVENMQRVKPSIFISIPKKWYQLDERIKQEVDVLKGSDEEIQAAVEKITGGNLKWGLSAAGHLDVEVFQFFQQNGIELMSGFGMTEATGGITMTPPGRYKPDSLGKALPGIDLRISDDGELLIKGPYVTVGYVNPEEAEVKFVDGWLPTGDIMQEDADGFIKIIDRKKEIYKNIKGETIAPQKIENYFRDFEFIKHVFLVGDHKPYNTLLIYPAYDYKDINLQQMSKEELREYFGSVIVSVNRFLAPFERIVDFNFIDRDFEQDKNELTPKGTYRRKVVENNFISFIKPMYERSYHSIRMDGNEIRIPNWFLRERGLTPDGIQVKNDKLCFKNISKYLVIKFKKKLVQVGNTQYKIQGKVLDFGKLLTDPVLWLGNEDLVEFSENKIFDWVRNEETREKILYHALVKPPKVEPDLYRKLESEEGKSEVSLKGIHEATLILYQKNETYSDAVLEYFDTAIKEQDSEVIHYTLEILQRTLNTSSIGTQRKAFILLLNTQRQHESDSMYKAFLDKSSDFINTDVITQICKSGFSDKKLEILFQITRDYCSERNKRGIKLFRLLSHYGATHPTRYKIIRQFLVSCQLADLESGFTRAARVARFECRDGFREWLGSTQEVAVDIETSEEYHWEDVIIFEESIDAADKARLLSSIINTTLVREAVFLFSEGVLVRLNDIPPGGLWVSLLGKEHGKAVYRITIQTRYQGSFDIAVNVNHEISFAEILDEITWLIQAGTTAGDQKLVEDFGGYWDEYDLWSEEFIPGETAGKFISRMIRQQDQTMNERLNQIWPYFIWSGVSAYVQFWKRTEKRLELDDPTPINIIIPKHDYQTGSRIVSISARREHLDPLDMLKNFMLCYIEEVEKQYGILKGVGKSKYIFSAIIEALGHKKGIAFLHTCIELLDYKGRKDKEKQLFAELKDYLSSVKEGGFIPKRLYFAIKRYHRWRTLSPSATNLARAATLSELYETYQLNLLEIEYPETRTRFFRDTVFAHSEKELRNGLKKIISEQQKGKIPDDRFTQHISALQKSIKLNEEDLLFLTRLSYPHLQPTDSADLISLEKGGISHTDIVVQTKDYDGDSFYIRGPVNPKEISRLHQLFLKNNLSVQFRLDHMYLVAVNERNQLIGGLFYKKNSEDTVHIEKIVVADFYRKKGVSDGLLREFFMRMKNEHYYFVTTGFFRPEYFYRFGFKVERKYAGLVKDLRE